MFLHTAYSLRSLSSSSQQEYVLTVELSSRCTAEGPTVGGDRETESLNAEASPSPPRHEIIRRPQRHEWKTFLSTRVVSDPPGGETTWITHSKEEFVLSGQQQDWLTCHRVEETRGTQEGSFTVGGRERRVRGEHRCGLTSGRGIDTI